MKTAAMFLLTFLFCTPPLYAQTKAVHFKKLQEFLPSIELTGMERKKPTGQTQTAMGMTTSEAKIRYVTLQKEEETEGPGEPVVTIEISISDLAGIPYGQMATMAYQQEFENETEDGYEKSITVGKTYKGKESVRTGDYKHCALEFAVGRFLVKMEADNTDNIALLRRLAESMNLAGLEKTST